VNLVLPPRLSELLAAEPDPSFVGRLGPVLEGAARAIARLGDLDLVRYEDAPIDESADLSLWEELAPVVGSTIADVNALLTELSTQFPEGEAHFEPKPLAVEATLRQGAQELRSGVMAFGMRVRDPSVVGDRWNLIGELQAFRLRFRDRIGALVFEVASHLGECRRRDVDPGYVEELSAALLVRSTSADLRRLMRARVQQVAEAPQMDVAWHARQIEKELNAFGRTAAWRAFRAQDKRAVLEFRTRVKALETPALEHRELDHAELLALLEPFAAFCDELEAANRREVLVAHDLEVLAALGPTLEQAASAASREQAREALLEALAQAQALYGRSADLDVGLRRLKKTPPTVETVRGDLEQFVVLVSRLSAV
jgi:hypothetical protein